MQAQAGIGITACVVKSRRTASGLSHRTMAQQRERQQRAVSDAVRSGELLIVA